MKSFVVNLLMLTAAVAVAGAALERDQPVPVDGLAVSPLRGWIPVTDPAAVPALDAAAVLGAAAPARAVYAALPGAGALIRADAGQVFGAIADAEAVDGGAAAERPLGSAAAVVAADPYVAARVDAPVEDAAGVAELGAGSAAVLLDAATVFRPAGLAGSTPLAAPVFAALPAGVSLADVRLAYARLLGMTATAVDPLVVPVDLWSAGPLGELRRQANAAGARGDKAAFDELAARYWALFNAAVERRRVLGEKTGRRKGGP